MLIQMIISTILTGMVGFASLKVWKADFSKKEKIQLISLLFGLLVIVAIANEAKNHHYLSFSLLELSEGECAESFYSILQEQPPPKFYNLPIQHKNTIEIIKKNIGQDDLMPEQVDSSFFIFMISKDNQGAGPALRYYAENLHQNGFAAFYLRLTFEVKDQSDLKEVLKAQNPEKFSDTIHWFNSRKGITPFIIVDHAHLAFSTESDALSSPLVKLLANAYLKYDAKIILHTHDHYSLTHFMQISRVQQFAKVIQYQPIEVGQIFEYLSQNLKDTFPKIQKQSLQQVDNSIRLDYEILSKLSQSSNKGSGIDTLKFIETELNEYKTKISEDLELYSILEEIQSALQIKEKISFTSKLIKLSDLKKKNIANLVSALIRLEQSGILQIEEGYISFDKRYFNAMLV